MSNNSNNTSSYEEGPGNGDKHTDSTLKKPAETTYNQSKYNTSSTANSKYAQSTFNNNNNNNNYNNSSSNSTGNSKYAQSTYNNNNNDNKYPYKNNYDKYNNNENSKYSRSSYNNNNDNSNYQYNNHSNSKYSASNSTEPRPYNKYNNQYNNYNNSNKSTEYSNLSHNNNSNKSKYDQRKTISTNNNQYEQQQPSRTKETESIDELSQGMSSLSTNDNKNITTKPANTSDDQVKVIECKGMSIEEVDEIFNKYESMRGGYGVKSINEDQILIVFGHTSTGSRAWQENNNNNKIQVFKGSMDLVKDVIPIRKSAMSQKPTSSNMVARRLIHGALGMKAPIRTEAQADQQLLDTARSERTAKREN
ncbi:unnamed protein product [Cunninghamella echinulata]